MAIERIKIRVNKGGHHIPDTIVKRRYKRGLENLFRIFIPECDYSLIIDNTHGKASLIAELTNKIDKFIYTAELWQQIVNLYPGEK